VDEKKISIVCGIDISFLTDKEQEWVLRHIRTGSTGISPEQAAKLKQYSQKKELSYAMVELILSEEKPRARRFTMKADRLSQYFDESVTEEEIENTIYKLLDEWKAGGGI
jgi:ParB family chromosome partitioning protein